MQPNDILRAILETEDDETIKDILGADYLEEPPVPEPEEGFVDRHDRWADISIGDKHFCISYLTPVAVYLPGEGITVTTRDWSNATKRHIVKWTNEIGFGNYSRYSEIQQAIDEGRVKEMDQRSLSELFKKWAARVHWSKRQARQAHQFRQPVYGLKGGTEDRIDVRPHQENE